MTFSSKAKQLIVLSGVLTYFKIFFGGGWVERNTKAQDQSASCGILAACETFLLSF